mmetsp:Transcript_37745/g.82643  ORF Transcript_37745/g.82643 Transcript_37745/m.82643 type:complete len:229 (-) Transcript_37745:407-1093(-)
MSFFFRTGPGRIAAVAATVVALAATAAMLRRWCRTALPAPEVAKADEPQPAVKAPEQTQQLGLKQADPVVAEAALHGHGELLKQELQAGKSPNGVFFDGARPQLTPLFAACLGKHEDCVKLLVDNKADLDAPCLQATEWDGAFTLTVTESALIEAVKQKQLSVVQVLLHACADVNFMGSSEYFDGEADWDNQEPTNYFSALNVAPTEELKQLLVAHGAKLAQNLPVAQ